MKPFLRWAIAPLLILPLSGNAAGDEFSLTVSGLRSTNGKLVVCVWSDRRGFPDCGKSSTAYKRVIPISARSMRVSLPVPAGTTTAVTVHHDEDANGRIKTNFIGIPSEGVGVSNNRGGIPNFGKAAIRITPGSQIAISMRYL